MCRHNYGVVENFLIATVREGLKLHSCHRLLEIVFGDMTLWMFDTYIKLQLDFFSLEHFEHFVKWLHWYGISKNIQVCTLAVWQCLRDTAYGFWLKLFPTDHKQRAYDNTVLAQVFQMFSITV